MAPDEKKFVLRHVFKKVSEMKEDEYYYSPIEEHFGIPWKIRTVRENGNLGFHLYCQLKKEDEWSIELKRDQTLLSMTGKAVTCNGSQNIINSGTLGWGFKNFVTWEELIKNHVVNDSFSVEVHVTILKMNGIKLRNFDESAAKYSDIVLIVGGTKFYVSKLYLASQSSYFDSLLFGNFEESKKSEITLSDVKADDFQNFLELLYGESSIDESTVEGVIHLSDMYDAKLAIRKCEKFLMKYSEKSLKEKLELAFKYNLKKLKDDCLSKISSSSDIRSVLSYDSSEMDPALVLDLLQKAISLNN
ncbi:unnamed protein product [Caenorhabditis nigoni]